ncbi:MAG: hypothetical protein H0W83_16965, partial [Planctomycetes bacterium]|nr:hypothetical protein [Planctomycetota bacterium]
MSRSVRTLSWSPVLPVLALLAIGGCVSAATVAEYIAQVDASIPADEMQDPGNPARAKAIDGLLQEDLGLGASETADLRLELAEAWLDALDPDQAEKTLAAVLAGKELSPPQRERAGLAWVAAWQVRLVCAPDPAALASPLATIAVFG